MPLYEFKCETCLKIEEHLLRFTDVSPETCLSCEGRLTKQVSQSSFVLKGSGWYETDFKTKSKDKNNKHHTSAPQKGGKDAVDSKKSSSEVKSSPSVSSPK